MCSPYQKASSHRASQIKSFLNNYEETPPFQFQEESPYFFLQEHKKFYFSYRHTDPPNQFQSY